jgi:hypothetical protein
VITALRSGAFGSGQEKRASNAQNVPEEDNSMYTATIDLTGRGSLTFLFTACWHWGNNGARVQEVKKVLLPRAKRSAGWWHLGDAAECIAPTDKRFASGTHTQTITRTCDMIAAAIQASDAQGNCKGFQMGNHEYSESARMGNITSDIICKLAEVPYRGFSCLVTIKCPKGSIRSYFTHGARSNIQRHFDPRRRDTNRRCALTQMLSKYDAELKGMGHWHIHIVNPPTSEEVLREQDGKPKLTPRAFIPAWHFATPAMFGGYGDNEEMPSYVERSQMPPVHIGWTEVIFNQNATVACIREVYGDGRTRNEHYPVILD